MTWRRVDPAVDTAGYVGGERQVSEAFSARWTRAHPTGCTLMVTRSYYVIIGGGRLQVEEQVEYLVCRNPVDPGGSEVTAEYEFATKEWGGPFDDTAARQLAVMAPEPADEEWNRFMAPEWAVS